MVRQRKIAIGALALGAGILSALAAGGFWGGLRLNLTPSYPLGIWRIQPIDREAVIGDLVFICPPDTPAFVLGVERGYLPAGLCPSGTAPLIKTVVAVVGQVVEVGDSIVIDGIELPNSRIRSMDAEGRPLSVFAGGQVPPGSVFLHSDFDGSYDSRYFGPLPASGILGFAAPVLVLAP
ncbi:conjugative transfer signal peptidase TraF [Devosia sp.]|uniref:conjugative transfer signal peptidase TraF n=1 Tax=Devosia sp. TaxID=1871048 RepID=UPI0019F8C436|nr:conjugative transfer signal peptidase TraF [Devosia sp.]MBE0581927.1 conjugative transfer signal peptidase TraF [Devosia sp.]